ncbi:antibiotic resistance protein VanZ [Spirochaetia bacterium]|nr:antibiotic resistance protein VanZ [Spirochaetia bacterium]
MYSSKFFKILLKIPAILVIAGIWFLSSQSVLPQPKGILGFDKFQHLLTYVVLAAAVGLWFPRQKWRRPGIAILLLAAAIGSAYGIIDEIHQSFVPGRDCNIRDWLADSLGALLGAGVMKFAAFKLRT